MRTRNLNPVFLLFATPALFAQVDLRLQVSVPSPARVGTFLTLNASAIDEQLEGIPLWYRFRIRESTTAFRTVRDFGPSPSLYWAPVEHEGRYEIEVTARNMDTSETAVIIEPYIVTPAVASDPAVFATPHPLVFLYSAPACQPGASMRVRFWGTNDATAQFTPFKSCDGRTMNFYLAGLRAEDNYSARYQLAVGAKVETGPVASFRSGALPKHNFPRFQVTKGSPNANNGAVLLATSLGADITATDLEGNLIWFYPHELSYLTCPEAGGTFWGFLQSEGSPQEQVLRRIDLAGVPLAETNAARVSEQLLEQGFRGITGFHHEVLPLPDDRIAVLASVLHHDILSDMIVVLDRNLNVVWNWDALDHLDYESAKPLLGENCYTAGCPPQYSGQGEVVDWLHGNSVRMTPDGSLLYSARHLDTLFKIDYRAGLGSGDILWKLGKGGDFQLDNGKTTDWFSHQHDATMLDDNTLVLFDNGNTREADDPEAQSRGQVYWIDQAGRKAKLQLNANVGAYSLALGSARRLPNGNFHFNVGFLPPFNSYSVEIDTAGEIVYRLDSSAPQYRTFRMTNLYTPLLNGVNP